MMLNRMILFAVAASAVGPICAAVPPDVLEAERSRVALVEKIAPTVVCIFGRDGGGGGSGVLISPDGFALTNFHVTSGAGDFMKCGLNDGRLYDAVIVGIDPTGDVALIKLLGRDDFPFAAFGDSDELRIGEWVYVMGNPFLLAADFTPTVTYGIVSGVHRYQYPAGTFLEYTDCIQFDTSLNPGNSGGPLFNDRGEVVGINGRGSFEKRGRVNVGAGYAISINQISHFLDHLRSGRVVDHGSLGAAVSTDGNGAVRVSSILEESDAWRRGLRSGDEIVTFAGRPIRSSNQFQNVLGIYPRGWMLPLTYRRGAETFDIVARLSGAHRDSELLEFSKSTPDQENPQPGRENEPQPDGKTPPDGETPEKESPEGLPAPHAVTPAVDDVPPELKSLVVKKPGFANHRFNDVERQRVFEALQRHGTFEALTDGIVLSGRTGDAKPFRMVLADAAVALEIGGIASVQPLEDGAEFLDEPAGTGGLLAAAHLFRQALLNQPDRLAGFYYYGSEPLDGVGPIVDVLIAEDRGATLRLYVERGDGRLSGFDFRRSDAAEECRVRFGDSSIAGTAPLPGEWQVRHGTTDVVELKVERIAPRSTGDTPMSVESSTES
ncbi:MAG: trypsin-like peptidase domain-containing protein [Planctomycetaceae bacterium]